MCNNNKRNNSRVTMCISIVVAEINPKNDDNERKQTSTRTFLCDKTVSLDMLEKESRRL